MAITKQAARYDVGGKAYESLGVWDDAVAGKRPVVLVTPTFMGRSAFEEEKAGRLAALGYAALVVDIFGIDVKPANFEEAGAAMQAVNGDRAGLAAMMQAALDAALGLPVADAGKVAAIGFCFGGKCVLDMARSGLPILGGVSFHGVYDRPDYANVEPIQAKLLVCHGWEDPIAPPEKTVALAQELTESGADWQIHAYGHAGHAFTDLDRKESKVPGVVYEPKADRRSWRAMTNFLEEVFA